MPSTARAQDDFDRYINAVVQLYNSGESELALEQLQRAKLQAREVEQDVSVALYEGLILMDLGQREQALAAFEAGLLLDPEAKLPLKVSPKVSDAFEAVRKQVLKMFSQPVRPSEKPELKPSALPPPRPYDPKPELVEQARSRVPVVPPVLAGIGITAAGVGAVFGLQSRTGVDDARRAQSQDETRAHLEKARSSARIANVLFGTAGLAATGALVTWWISRGEAATDHATGER